MKKETMKLLLSIFLVSVPASAQHTYYISNSSGSDSNTSTQAQSKSTPWQHLHGMVSCTSNCSSYTPVPGDRFILKGGDTWHTADLSAGWNTSGTSGSRIYIGVDQTWYAGNSWTRPVWTCDGTSTCNGGAVFRNSAQYTTVDNIEVTGFHTSGGGGGDIFLGFGENQEYEHIYVHGWSHSATGDNDTAQVFGFGGSPVNLSSVHDCIIDGSDTTQDMIVAFSGNIPIAYNNRIQYVSNGFEASGDDWHDNYITNIGKSFAWAYGPQHQNAMFHFGPAYTNNPLLYNNVITGIIGSICADVCGGVVKLWFNGNGATTATGYAFNNVIYNNSTGNFINFGNTTMPPKDFGTFNFFNNTVECGSDSATQQCFGDTGAISGEMVTFHSINNHWISNQTPAVSCTIFTCTSTNDILQTVATANGQGYNSSQTYPFSPANSGGSTIHAGETLSSTCTTVGSIGSAVGDTNAGTACAESSTYACIYNTGNHTLTCPNAAQNTRDSAWDAGAWQFSGSGPIPPPPPTNLLATPH